VKIFEKSFWRGKMAPEGAKGVRRIRPLKCRFVGLYAVFPRENAFRAEVILHNASEFSAFLAEKKRIAEK
jgi:hypothetical protein